MKVLLCVQYLLTVAWVCVSRDIVTACKPSCVLIEAVHPLVSG
jgi:hypothetical protein